MKEKKKLKKFSVQALFSNNKFVLVFSFAAAFFIWASVAIHFSPQDTRVIENVKVNVQNNIAEGLDLQVFGDSETTVDVTVTGKRYAISSTALTADDINVTAKGGYIDSAGKYNLSLSAAPVNTRAAFDIVSLSKTEMTVYYDILKEQEFDVTVNLKAQKGIAPEGYISEEPVPSLSTVTVKGPAAEINKISSVSAIAKLEKPVTETTILDADISVKTENEGSTLNYISFLEDTETCTVTVPVYMKKQVRLTVHYLNLPASYGNSLPAAVIKPSVLTVAAAKSTIEEMKALDIGSIDFTKLQAKNNVFTFKVSDIDEVKVVDEISEITVSLDFTGYSTKELDIPASNVSCLNVPVGYEVKPLNGIRKIVIIGPPATLEAISPSEIFAKIDFSKKVNKDGSFALDTGDSKVRADVYISDGKYNACWVYGKYSITVNTSGGETTTAD